MLAEVYPSIVRNRFAREGRTPDEQDAYAVTRWLGEGGVHGLLERYINVPLTIGGRRVAELEGWILGIG